MSADTLIYERLYQAAPSPRSNEEAENKGQI